MKVRGQRTRTSGRKGGAVGVAKAGLAAPVKKGDPGAPGAAPAAEGAADQQQKEPCSSTEKKAAPAAEKKAAPAAEKKEAPAEKKK